MKDYRFHTNAYMKEYYHDKYWIMRDALQDIIVSASNLKFAIDGYAEMADRCGYRISNSAKKSRDFIYDNNGNICGLCFTAKTTISDRSAGVECDVYVDLYAHITTETIPDELVEAERRFA